MLNISHSEADLFTKDWFLIGDMFDFICGVNIGIGTYRSVYDFQLDSNYVVKIERPNKGFYFNNASEFDIWANIKVTHKSYMKFLAPCYRLSNCGRILLQRKTTPVTLNELPKLIPAFLGDTKLANWGRIGKNVVCHDYANHRLYSNLKNEFIKPRWHSK